MMSGTEFRRRHRTHCEQVDAEQEAERNVPIRIRQCRYCGQKLEILYKGRHDAAEQKCKNCGQINFCAPVSFRIAR